jgi:hypothetical protein
MSPVATVNRREREQHRRTILSMLETTPATVARPVAPGEAAEPIPDIDFDWRPHPLDRTVSSRRTYRFPIVVGAVVAAVAILVAARFLVQVPADRATALQAEYVTALSEFGQALDSLDRAPTVTDPDVATGFVSAVEALRVTADIPLPWSIPLIPLGPDLGPARARMQAVVDTAADLATEVAGAGRYRAAADDVIAIPLLPFDAPPELIDPAAKALADMQAGTETALASLDDDPAYAAYRAAARDAAAALPQWIDRYLLALRRGDTTTSAALIAELQGTKADLEAQLAAVLDQVDAHAAEAIPALRAGVEAARVLTG